MPGTAALGRQYAPDFRLSQFFRSDEMGLSAMLAFLLDPQATHGQRDGYLVEFLKTCDLPDIAITQHFLRVLITEDGGPDNWPATCRYCRHFPHLHPTH